VKAGDVNDLLVTGMEEGHGTEDKASLVPCDEHE